jgi:hypothetical protein
VRQTTQPVAVKRTRSQERLTFTWTAQSASPVHQHNSDKRWETKEVKYKSSGTPTV